MREQQLEARQLGEEEHARVRAVSRLDLVAPADRERRPHAHEAGSPSPRTRRCSFTAGRSPSGSARRIVGSSSLLLKSSERQSSGSTGLHRCRIGILTPTSPQESRTGNCSPGPGSPSLKPDLQGCAGRDCGSSGRSTRVLGDEQHVAVPALSLLKSAHPPTGSGCLTRTRQVSHSPLAVASNPATFFHHRSVTIGIAAWSLRRRHLALLLLGEGTSGP